MFKKKIVSVDEALAPIKKTMSDLEMVSATRDAQAASARSTAEILETQANADEEEGLRARKVLHNLRAIVGEDE